MAELSIFVVNYTVVIGVDDPHPSGPRVAHVRAWNASNARTVVAALHSVRPSSPHLRFDSVRPYGVNIGQR
jgi:hypothetical protein